MDENFFQGSRSGRDVRRRIYTHKIERQNFLDFSGQAGALIEPAFRSALAGKTQNVVSLMAKAQSDRKVKMLRNYLYFMFICMVRSSSVGRPHTGYVYQVGSARHSRAMQLRVHIFVALCKLGWRAKAPRNLPCGIFRSIYLCEIRYRRTLGMLGTYLASCKKNAPCQMYKALWLRELSYSHA